jgi:hypothetical protein
MPARERGDQPPGEDRQQDDDQQEGRGNDRAR